MSEAHTLPPIFVVGSGRSGTTWIGGTIASCSGCAPIFEPLQPELARVSPPWGRKSGFPGPYLRSRGSYPQWEAFFDAILAGQLTNWWTRMDWSRVPESLTRWRLPGRIAYRLAKTRYQLLKMRSNRYVVKEIRANLMLDWLVSYTGARIMFVIRHPCATIGSRMQQPAQGWQVDMDEILCQSSLMAEFLEPFRKTINGASTLLERQTIMWCVENLVPLSQASSRDWLMCCYEDFLADRDVAFERVFDALGLEPSSSTARTKRLVVDKPINDLNKPRPWYAPLKEAEGEEVLRLCREFGLGLYGKQSMPLYSPREFLDDASIAVAPESASTDDSSTANSTATADGSSRASRAGTGPGLDGSRTSNR